MSLREVWYGGDGGTEAKQARTSEREGGGRVSFVTGLRGREKRGREERAQLWYRSLRTVGEGSQLRKEGRRENMRAVKVNNPE